MVFIFILFFVVDDDSGKFTRLYEKYHGPLLSYAYSILRNRHLSEDAVQEAYIRVLKNLHKISENDCSKTWHYMVIIVRHVSFSVLQKERASMHQDIGELGPDKLEDQAEPAWSEYQAKELYEKIKDYIYKNLNEADRQIMILRCVHNMSYKDISGMVGLTEGNVSAKLSRLRKKMKADLAREGAAL